MEIKVKALDGVEQKSVQEVEADLLEKHEEEVNPQVDNSQEEVNLQVDKAEP